MKKSRKMIGAIGLTIAVSLGIGGCGKVTTEKALNKMYEKLEKNNAYDATLTIDTKFALSTQGMNMDMLMNGTFDMQMDQSTRSMHMDGTMDMEVFGQKIDMDMDMYSVPENGEMTSYMKVVAMGENSGWVRSDDEANSINMDNMDEFIKEYQKDILKKMAENVTLAEDTVEINGVECYVLTGIETGDMIEPVIDYLKENISAGDEEAVEQMVAAFDKIDWSKVEIPMELYVDKKEYMPVKINMDMKSSMNYLISESMDLAMELASGKLPEGFDMDITFETCNVEMIYNSLSESMDITVPEEVKESAVDVSGGLDALEDSFGMEEESEGTLPETSQDGQTDTDTTEEMEPVA